MAVSAVSLSYGHLRSITCTTDSYCNMYHLVYMFVKTYRSLKFQVDITNHQLIQDRQQERSQREPKFAAEEEKEA